MGDRERGVILVALSLALLVVVIPDLDRLDSWRTRVELALVPIGLLVGLALALLGRSR
jgi:hypothetical protein